ncbi:MAG: hypothetical protein HYS12_07475, partial [Planctomycetes bacterium]|nr:hypothetical protein [Planctomycetota bacterium]
MAPGCLLHDLGHGGLSGKRFRLDRPLRHNFWLIGEATAVTLFPLLCGDEIADVVIEDLVLDGNRKKNDHLDG